MGMDGLVHQQLRTFPKGVASEVHSLCRTSAGCRDPRGNATREFNNSTQGSTQDDSSQEQSCRSGKGEDSAPSRAIGKIMDASGDRVGGGDVSVCDSTPRGRSVFHEAGKSSAESASLGPRRGFAGSDHPSEEEYCQGRTVTSSNHDEISHPNQLKAEEADYEFFTSSDSHNFHRECSRWIKKLTLELEQVMSEEHLFPKKLSRLQFLEVMCSDESEITKQANHLGVRAARFGLAQGDLRGEHSPTSSFSNHCSSGTPKFMV